jgi:hypothetical protein
MENKNQNEGQKKPLKKSAAKKAPMSKAQSAVDEFINESTLETDPLGSYTGYLDGEGFSPSQDADDL